MHVSGQYTHTHTLSPFDPFKSMSVCTIDKKQMPSRFGTLEEVEVDFMELLGDLGDLGDLKARLGTT